MKPSPRWTAEAEHDRAGHRPRRTRPRSAPGVTHGPVERQLGRAAGLAPADERRKAFRLPVAVLAVADERRRERFCSGGCGHWWHRPSAAEGRRVTDVAGANSRCVPHGTATASARVLPHRAASARRGGRPARALRQVVVRESIRVRLLRVARGRGERAAGAGVPHPQPSEGSSHVPPFRWPDSSHFPRHSSRIGVRGAPADRRTPNSPSRSRSCGSPLVQTY
ncbi:DUF5958 family protein [Streptomyces sp. NPDC018056]|uniref:DUF5958 family protein n=1 Tax=Streptomyces sp. NPDC018056 TaxID=3365039 RepID=UPI0037995639